jgi:hypothetical protein
VAAGRHGLAHGRPPGRPAARSALPAGSVASTHSARLQATACVAPAGSVVTGSSHSSASRTASATAADSLPSTDRSPLAATTCRATSWASSQLTGPPHRTAADRVAGRPRQLRRISRAEHGADRLEWALGRIARILRIVGHAVAPTAATSTSARPLGSGRMVGQRFIPACPTTVREKRFPSAHRCPR